MKGEKGMQAVELAGIVIKRHRKIPQRQVSIVSFYRYRSVNVIWGTHAMAGLPQI
jgi:hypothetical protein